MPEIELNAGTDGSVTIVSTQRMGPVPCTPPVCPRIPRIPALSHAIARMSAEGAQVSGHTLNLAAGSSPSLSVTLASGSAEVEGIAKRSGKLFAGAMVVLVPKNPEANRDLFRRDQSDLDGTFVLHGVIPGSYTLLAIDNGWDLDWSKPGVIAVYLKHGRTIQVGSQSGRPINVAEPIQVQSK